MLTACQSESNDHSSCYHLKDLFNTLEGRYTKYWKKDFSEKDKKLLKLLNPIYKKLVDEQFLETDQTIIPKTLHFIWLGPKNFPEDSVKYVRSWLAKHPGWEAIFWTDRFRLPPCNHMQVKMVHNFDWKYLKNYYDQTLNWAEKSDYLRYEILLDYGGIYVDHDVYCYEPFDALVNHYHFFAGLELPHQAIQGYAITPCNALMGSTPKHALLYEVIKFIQKEWDTNTIGFCEKRILEYQLVMQRSYMPLTYAIQSKIASAPGKNIIFPAAYFYSKYPLPLIYAKHQYSATWGPSKPEKVMHKTKDILKRFSVSYRKQKKWVKRLLLLNSILLFGIIFALMNRRKKAV